MTAAPRSMDSKADQMSFSVSTPANNLIQEKRPNRKIAGNFSLVRGAGSTDSPTNFMMIIIVQPFKFYLPSFT